MNSLSIWPCPLCRVASIEKTAPCCNACMERVNSLTDCAEVEAAVAVMAAAYHARNAPPEATVAPVKPAEVPEALAVKAAAIVRAQLDWTHPRAQKRQLSEGQILALLGTAQRRGRPAWTCIRVSASYGQRGGDGDESGGWTPDSDFVQVSPLRDGSGWRLYATRQRTLRTYVGRYCEHTDEQLAEREAWPILVEVRDGKVKLVRTSDKAEANKDRWKAQRAADAKKALKGAGKLRRAA